MEEVLSLHEQRTAAIANETQHRGGAHKTGRTPHTNRSQIIACFLPPTFPTLKESSTAGLLYFTVKSFLSVCAPEAGFPITPVCEGQTLNCRKKKKNPFLMGGGL